MHVLEHPHIKLKPEEAEKLIRELNISTLQLPKIKVNDSSLPEDCKVGDVIKIERKDDSGKSILYYRVVSV